MGMKCRFSNRWTLRSDKPICLRLKRYKPIRRTAALYTPDLAGDDRPSQNMILMTKYYANVAANQCQLGGYTWFDAIEVEYWYGLALHSCLWA